MKGEKELCYTTSRLIDEKIENVARFLKSSWMSVEWIQTFFGHAFYKTTMNMYGTLSIYEMQQEAENRLQE